MPPISLFLKLKQQVAHCPWSPYENDILTAHLSWDGGYLPSSNTETGLDLRFIQTFSFWYILLFSLITDGVEVTSLLSRLDKFEIFLGKIFVILLMLCGGRCSEGVPTLGVDGNPRVLLGKAVVAESEVQLCRIFGEE